MQSKEQLIHKLFEGNCTRQDLILLFEMIQQEPASEGPEIMLELSRQMGEVPALPTETSAHIFAKVQSTLEAETREEEIAKKPAGILRNLFVGKNRWYSSMAASLLLLLGLWGGLQLFQGPDQIAYQTQAGEILEVRLPDQSLVTLNGKTSLSVASSWEAGETRIVRLEGEAYFQVEKKPATQAKFQVVTPELTVEVLGTSFNVNSREEKTNVFLDEGNITIKLDHQSEKEVLLQPGELLSYGKNQSGTVRPQQVESELYTSWKTGVLVFKEASLAEILDKIALANDLTYEIKDENLKKRTFTFGLPTEELEITISALERLIGEKIVRDGKRLLIGPNP